MKRGQNEDSQSYRATNGNFKSEGGKFTGYKPGVANGPAPRTDRGRKRTKVKW